MPVSDTLMVAQDPTMPKHRCIVIVDSEIVYAGRIGKPVLPFVALEGALLILHPEDFADGEAFFRSMARPN